MILHSFTEGELVKVNTLIAPMFKYHEVRVAPYRDRLRFFYDKSIDGYDREDVEWLLGMGLEGLLNPVDRVMYCLNCPLSSLPLLVHTEDVVERCLVRYRLEIGK
jgi:hypothetical protein